MMYLMLIVTLILKLVKLKENEYFFIKSIVIVKLYIFKIRF